MRRVVQGVQPVRGAHCPMGCGATVVLDCGTLRCDDDDCPRLRAAGEILADAEHDHIVELGERSFNVKHPLRERLDDALLGCDLGEWLRGHSGPPALPGRYRARFERGAWILEPVDVADERSDAVR